MALLRWEVRKNKDSFFNIYFEHQGEDEEDWAYDEGPADEKVDTNFLLSTFLERVSISQSGFSSAGWWEYDLLWDSRGK